MQMRAPILGRVAVDAGLVTRHTLRGPSWRRLLPDVYIEADAMLDHRSWCAAVTLTLPGGSAIDRCSAAYLHGVDLLPTDAPVTVTMPQPSHSWPRSRVSVTRTTLGPDDIATVDGMPVTTPVRTAFDLARQHRIGPAVAALDALCRQHLVTVAEVAGYARSWRRLRGAGLLIKRLALVDPRAESPMESRLRGADRDGGVAGARPAVRGAGQAESVRGAGGSGVAGAAGCCGVRRGPAS